MVSGKIPTRVLVGAAAAAVVLAGGGGEDHDPLFQCNCFRCYMSYWVKWDTSPNRQLIHEIIDAYEEGLFLKNKSVKAKKEKKRRDHHREKNFGERSARVDELGELESVEESCSGEVEIGCGGDDGEVGMEKGSVRKLVSFIGEKIWGVWNR
ncbi:hypothetical protein L1049_025048 [Liquidambar formosana]|uniref:Uncharacterized protein n=1 Tax=Liquidambar formosana TaxID=63359 RepID=A0AAP0X080_LIQFO